MDSAETAAYGRNIWAEQSVVGSMLIDARVVGLVMASLTEDDFLLEAVSGLPDPLCQRPDAGPGFNLSGSRAGR